MPNAFGLNAMRTFKFYFDNALCLKTCHSLSPYQKSTSTSETNITQYQMVSKRKRVNLDLYNNRNYNVLLHVCIFRRSDTANHVGLTVLLMKVVLENFA